MASVTGFDARLPPAAMARLAELRASGTWVSALSADEFAATRAVGPERGPVRESARGPAPGSARGSHAHHQNVQDNLQDGLDAPEEQR
ncbi:MAG TPA: hypothetical protein VFQ44_04680 [Streptosporangiaceae bacterium]|nr:hypothetical protein [Streptosporangiaceae bacterium]